MPFEDSSPLPISSHPAGIMGGWGGDLSPGLHSGRFIVNEVTFLKGCVLLTAGWTKALVILTEKKEGKEETSRVAAESGKQKVRSKGGGKRESLGRKGEMKKES